MSDIPDDVYKKYSIRNEYSLFVTNDERMSNPTIGQQTWRLYYCTSDPTILASVSINSSDNSKTVAEFTLWYWKNKTEMEILKKSVQAFGAGSSNVSVSTSTDGITPVNRKFYVLIRVLDERIATDNNSLETYYDCDGVDTVKLCVVGTDTFFIVPKDYLIEVSGYYQRMFASEMTEKKTGIVPVNDTNPEDFCDFLKAISPKQEYPNPSNVLALLHLAWYHDCQSLLDRCEAHLVNCVEIPLVELLNLVKTYQLHKLKAKLMDSFREIGLLEFVRQVKPHLDLYNQPDLDLVNQIATMIE